MKANIVTVTFRRAGRLFRFDAGSLALRTRQAVVVETNHGLDLGTVVSPPEERDWRGNGKLFRVIRAATDEDLERLFWYKRREEEAFSTCKEMIVQHELPMKLVKAEYLYSGNRLIFHFSADGRVDFRGLVRDLARHFRMRIEMKQIGVRDEAKLLGGIGQCGQEVCCIRFLRDFSPVSIRMAKDQGLALNPQKVSGLCGRLMCCLVYEQGIYKEARKRMPKVGRRIETPSGEARVRDVDVLTERIRVELADRSIVEFKLDELNPPAPPCGGKGAPCARAAAAQDEGAPREQASGSSPPTDDGGKAATRKRKRKKRKRKKGPGADQQSAPVAAGADGRVGRREDEGGGAPAPGATGGEASSADSAAPAADGEQGAGSKATGAGAATGGERGAQPRSRTRSRRRRRTPSSRQSRPPETGAGKGAGREAGASTAAETGASAVGEPKKGEGAAKDGPSRKRKRRSRRRRKTTPPKEGGGDSN